MLDRSSLPRLLRARRQRPYVGGGTVSLDAGGDATRVGRYRSRRAEDNRRRSEGTPVRSDPPEQALVALLLRPDLPHEYCWRDPGGRLARSFTLPGHRRNVEAVRTDAFAGGADER